MQAVTLSQKGLKSEKNEDACLVLNNKCLFVVADGVGGGPRGDFASRTLVDEIYRLCGLADRNNSIEKVLIQAIQNANKLIFDAAQAADLNGMATTLVCAVIKDKRIVVMHVGDSRAYRLRCGEIMALTKDHTKSVQRPDNQFKSVITNAVGIRSSIKIELNRFDWDAKDQLLLLSDGITDVLDDSVILSILNNAAASMADRIKRLVLESERQGGRDDKTVVLVYER
ncbi:serine/threonine-protein phosphatase [Ketobacter sp. MCCC 1A13808]|uniref:protein phosphatase 2C domain-containing protein n=1 Tax=Ketobacter sp. MCCC 1A13808 TaxID=2602738 RepID=UPI0012EBFE33|nr:protein phosphatase 2C domain-containing protein [Ketobacter sp. MCCC 1A13808]MVF12523.1 serine/threonine-protein phosphatase [Ketobacter sp. MCCC 1A13808]